MGDQSRSVKCETRLPRGQIWLIRANGPMLRACLQMLKVFSHCKYGHSAHLETIYSVYRKITRTVDLCSHIPGPLAWTTTTRCPGYRCCGAVECYVAGECFPLVLLRAPRPPPDPSTRAMLRNDLHLQTPLTFYLSPLSSLILTVTCAIKMSILTFLFW